MAVNNQRRSFADVFTTALLAVGCFLLLGCPCTTPTSYKSELSDPGAGVWVVPANVVGDKVKVTIRGAGGGGGGGGGGFKNTGYRRGSGGGAGGSAGEELKFEISTKGLTNIAYTIGRGGDGGAGGVGQASGATGSSGQPTNFLTATAAGGGPGGGGEFQGAGGIPGLPEFGPGKAGNGGDSLAEHGGQKGMKHPSSDDNGAGGEGGGFANNNFGGGGGGGGAASNLAKGGAGGAGEPADPPQNRCFDGQPGDKGSGGGGGGGCRANDGNRGGAGGKGGNGVIVLEWMTCP